MRLFFVCGGEILRKLKKYKPTKFKEKTSVYDKDAADYGKQVAGNMLVVCAIAKVEKIDPDALYDEKVAQYAKQSGYSDVATLEKDYSQKYLRQVIINEEVLNVLEENAVAVAPTETESEASK